MSKLILIYNWKIKADESFPLYLQKQGIDFEIIDNPDDGTRRYLKWYKIVNTIECLVLALKAICKAEKNDVIVSMCATPGIFASFCNVKHNKLVILNLLCHFSDKPGIAERIRNKVYSLALNKKGVWATCNAKEDVYKFSQMFTVDSEHILQLPDGIEIDNKKIEAIDFTSCAIDVFSCGASARDWETLVKAAKICSNLKFYVIARECDWKDSYNLENLTVEFNVPHDEYLQKMRQSKLVVLPLKSEITAGLLVMFDAIKSKKNIIVTKTVSTEQFVPNELYEFSMIKMQDANDLVCHIRKYMKLPDKEKLQMLNMQKSYLYENYSESHYNQRLLSIVNDIIQND